jgi:hypothetical protein
MFHRMKRLWILAFLLLAGCKPARDNPYDPQSAGYVGEGTVKGRVTSPVGTPLQGALVLTVPVGFTAVTGSNGKFAMNPEPGTWRFTAQLPGYVPDTTSLVNIAPGETREFIDFRLNGIPVVESCRVISCHEDRGWPVGSVYWAEVTALIQDPDGIQDIDSVRVIIGFDTTELAVDMSFVSGITYEAEIDEIACPDHRLESLIGRAFIIHAVDTKRCTGASSHFYVPRIIYELPHTVSPTYLDDPVPPIDFVWNRMRVSHSITYNLIVQNRSSLEVVHTEHGVLDTTCTIDFLPTGSYLWRVEGVDEFGDLSCSNKESFQVQ